MIKEEWQNIKFTDQQREYTMYVKEERAGVCLDFYRLFVDSDKDGVSSPNTPYIYPGIF
jgi:hypothetical protein